MTAPDPDGETKDPAAQENSVSDRSPAGAAQDVSRAAARRLANAAEARATAAEAVAGAQADAAAAGGDAPAASARVPSGPAASAVQADLDEAAADVARAEADAAAAVAEGGNKRRRPIGAVVLLALAAALLWASSRMTWVSLEVTSDKGLPKTVHLNGSTWFGALTPLALVLLATIAAVFATKGWMRRLVGVVVAVLAAVAAVPGFALLVGKGKTAERAATLAELRTWEAGGAVTTATLPALLAVVGAIAAFLAGLLLTRMPSESAQMSGKYDNPVFRKSAAAEQVAEHHAVNRASESGSQAAAAGELSGRVLWDALDAGADPTDDQADTVAAHEDPGSGPAGRGSR